MFRKVMWATDGSEAADKALPVVKMFASDSGTEVLVVHCLEMTLPGRGGNSVPVNANEEDLRAKIEGQVAELSDAGVAASLVPTHAVAGGTARAIAEAAERNQADVIVVGTRGHTALGGLLLGSVTQRLLHITPCPVLAVPARDGHAGG